MKIPGAMLLALALPVAAMAQTNSIADLLAVGEEFIRDNVDDDVLALLDDVDRERVEDLFKQFQERFDSEYVLDVPKLEATAKAILPLLEANEETQPYAVWLKTRLDYFQAADEMTRDLPRPPLLATNQPPIAPVQPGPELERKVWKQQLEKRPVPPQAEAHVATLKKIFAENGVPSELVWLAEVESSFDPRARSPVGAVGLFQLMPDTAKQMGLSIWPSDERKQPGPSAQAAAKYLKYLYGQFKDWRLALAAYNAGEGRVRNLLERRKATTFEGIAPKLPAETQMFVPKVEATLLRREGAELAKLKLG